MGWMGHQTDGFDDLVHEDEINDDIAGGDDEVSHDEVDDYDVGDNEVVVLPLVVQVGGTQLSCELLPRQLTIVKSKSLFSMRSYVALQE